jgi:ribosomal protein S6--L-glutamate ligase
VVGWQEWCALPAIHIPAIKTKIDTGAKTAALHATDIEIFHRHDKAFVRFIVQPFKKIPAIAQHCQAPLIDQRLITNSGGSKELRAIIMTTIRLGAFSWEIEIGLTNRDLLTFPMLLGRDALKGHNIVDPARILCQGKQKMSAVRKLY